jgi:hypothetical protein
MQHMNAQLGGMKRELRKIQPFIAKFLLLFYQVLLFTATEL